jgi:hypothetical protein
MPYSESLFFLLLVIEFSLIRRNFNPYWIAAAAGAASATRITGICLYIPVVVYAFSWYGGFSSRFTLHIIPITVCALSGVILWMLAQKYYLGNALAFVTAQQHWQLRDPKYFSSDTLLFLLRGEPFWAVIGPSGHDFHRGITPNSTVLLFDWDWVNVISIMGMLSLIVLGIRAGWINRYEVGFAFAMLLFVYCLQGPRAGVASGARYMSVILPGFTVAGQLLYRGRPWMSCIVLSVAAVFLALFSACYVAGYYVF